MIYLLVGAFAQNRSIISARGRKVDVLLPIPPFFLHEGLLQNEEYGRLFKEVHLFMTHVVIVTGSASNMYNVVVVLGWR